LKTSEVVAARAMIGNNTCQYGNMSSEKLSFVDIPHAARFQAPAAPVIVSVYMQEQ
jgi:hypothetical protein